MVTHIIASNLTPKKKEEFKRYRIVKPAWIVESVTAGKLLPWDAYRVVDEGVGQKVLGFENGNIISQANQKAQGYKEQTDTSWYTAQLKAQDAPKQPPSFTQIVTPGEEIEEDEYPLPELTSSMEEALASIETIRRRPQKADAEPASPNLVDVRKELKTPPPSSPVPLPNAVSVDETDEEDTKTGEASAAPGEQQSVAEDPEREVSWPQDYSMAVVRGSAVLNAIPPEQFAKMTAEEHNALLLSDPKIRKSTVVHPDFLVQYYRESRLHHLSTWKADLKSQLQALAAEKSLSQKVQLKKLPGQRRYIMHVDFDSFFAAVSLKKNPEYKDKPAVVAHGGGSGSEIASCNYPARKFGVHNGMWMKRAQQLCPELKILPYDFPGYEDASRKFYDAILATNGIVQSVSIDEALVDISAICFSESGSNGVDRAEGAVSREELKADEVAWTLRDEVLNNTGCAVSVGIGGNILLAKVALRKAKPAGQFQLKPEDILDFIGELEVQSLPGVAWSTGGKLEEIGIKLVKDIRECSKERLINTLGPKTGEKLWEYARGIDRAAVGDSVVRKSVSAEVNWGVRFENQEQVDEFMHGLCGELHKRLLKERVKGKQLTMKVMRRATDAPLDPPKHLGHGKCDTYNKSLQLGVATNQTEVIVKEAIAMMRSFGISPGELRGIGVQMQKLEPLRSGPQGLVESSQRRLQFKIGLPNAPVMAESSRRPIDDPIKDDIKTPEARRVADINQPSVSIERFTASTPTKKQLNTLGTQFVLPTQVDPRTLAELPEDIREKLVRRANAENPPAPHDPGLLDAREDSRERSPSIALPNQSQLDPDILSALPDDVRAEVLGFYKTSHRPGGQGVLPQSPRKARTIPASKLSTKQPVKRKRGGGLFSRTSRLPASDVTTLTQANFVSRPQSKPNDSDAANGTDSEAEAEALDPAFLAALPDDLRAEVLAQQRQAQLQRKGGIDLSLHQKATRYRGKKKEEAGPLDRHLQLAPRPAKPTFTMKKFSELPDLRSAIRAWHQEFADEGPYDEDVEALLKYLGDVVLEERDVAKAVAVVNWLDWVLGESVSSATASKAWMSAKGRVEDGVQTAVAQRGLGKVDFG